MFRGTQLAGFGIEPDHPIFLFEPGVPGYLLDPMLTASPMFTDTAGTTPLTADNEVIQHIKTLGPNAGHFSGTNDFRYRSGPQPYIQYPTNGADLSGSNITNVFHNATGVTVCLAYYVASGGSGNSFLYRATNQSTNHIMFELYNNGACGFNIDTPSITTPWWENQIVGTGATNQWVIATGTYDCSTGVSNLRINGVQSATTTYASGNFNTDGVFHALGGAGQTVAETRVGPIFANARLMPIPVIQKLEGWMRRRVALI